MAKQTEGGWECSICGELYDRDVYAVSCEQSHNIVYIPFKRDDLYNLIQYLYTGDNSLLTKSLIDTLMKYRTGSYV